MLPPGAVFLKPPLMWNAVAYYGDTLCIGHQNAVEEWLNDWQKPNADVSRVLLDTASKKALAMALLMDVLTEK
jgi:hypothetical protein